MESNWRQGGEFYCSSSNGDNDHKNMPETRNDHDDLIASSNSRVLEDLFWDLHSFESLLSPATVNELRSCSKYTPPDTPNNHQNLAGSLDNLRIVIPGLSDEDEISPASTSSLDTPLTESDASPSGPENVCGIFEMAQMNINDGQFATTKPYSTTANRFESQAFVNWNEESSATTIATAIKWSNSNNGARSAFSEDWNEERSAATIATAIKWSYPNNGAGSAFSEDWNEESSAATIATAIKWSYPNNGAGSTFSEAEQKNISRNSISPIRNPIANPRSLNENVTPVSTQNTNNQQLPIPVQSSLMLSTNGNSYRPGDLFNPHIYPQSNHPQENQKTKSWTIHDTNTKSWTMNSAQVDKNTKAWTKNHAQVDTNTMSWTMNPATKSGDVMNVKPRTSLSFRGSSSWIASSCTLESTSATGQYPNSGQTTEHQASSSSAQQVELSGNHLQDVKRKQSVCLDHPNYPTWFFCAKDRSAVCCVCIIEGLGNHVHTGEFRPVPLPNCGDDGDARLKNVRLLEKAFLQMYRILPTYMANRNPFEMSENNHLVFDQSKFSQFPSLALTIEHFNELLVLVNIYEKIHVGFENAIRSCYRTFMTFEKQNNNVVYRHLPLTGDYPVHLPNCYVEGQGTFESVAGCSTCFFVVVKDVYGAPCEIGKFPLDINVKRVLNDEKKVAVSTRHYKDGVLKILTQFDKVGDYSFSIRINGTEVQEPKILLQVKAKANTLLGMRAASHLNIPALYNRMLRVCVNDIDETFFSEKDQNGFEVWSADFTRCVSSTRLGTAVENLSEPTGIAIDQNNDLVICDGGNNRICVFGFGKDIRQSPASANLYRPTSVVVNASNQYIVLHSESKICAMSSDFQQLNHIDLSETKPDIRAWGICLGFLDEVFVTDCNSGDILVVDIVSKVSKIAFTCNGDGRTTSRRSMRGIAVNKQGYFIVADYGNSCIEAYSQTGYFMEKFPFRERPLDVAIFKNSKYDLIVTRERAPPILIGAQSRFCAL